MAKASREQPNVADKQLAGINVAEAKRKWREGLPVSLKQMAVALEMGYSTVRQYSKMPGFPMLKGFVHPKHFDHWLKECFQEQSSGASTMQEGGFGAQIEGGTKAVTGTGRLPIQAQRLLEVAGIRK